jgi:hypothetical protein
MAIPTPPPGESIDPSKAVVTYQANASAPAATLPHVNSSADCGSGGWYFDDNTMPTKILLCPDTCSTAQGQPGANLKVAFGCSRPLF